MLKLSKTWTSKLGNFKRLLIALGLLVVLIVIAIGYILSRANHSIQQNKIFANPDLDVKTYSLNGKLIKIENNIMELQVGQVITTKAGNEIEYKTFYAGIPPDMEVVKRNPEQPSNFVTAPFSEIKPGINITVYSSSNPYESNQFTAGRVEIIY